MSTSHKLQLLLLFGLCGIAIAYAIIIVTYTPIPFGYLGFIFASIGIGIHRILEILNINDDE